MSGVATSSSRGRASGAIARRGGAHHHTNDTAPIIGRDLVVSEEVDHLLSDAVHETISRGMNHATRKDYRNRIGRMIVYLKENFAEYYQMGVRDLTAEECGDRTKFYFEKKQDLIYTGLNVQYFIFFLSSA